MTKMKFCKGREENIVVTGETAGYKHFLLVQICFPKAIVFRISKSPDHLVQGHKISIYTTDSIIRYKCGSHKYKIV